MPTPTRQKITFGEMRAARVRGLLVYCADYKCAHSVRMDVTATHISYITSTTILLNGSGTGNTPLSRFAP